VEALIAQIRKDVELARQTFAKEHL
jgi:hypothetical protein